MKRLVFVLVCAIVLGGCAHPHRYHGGKMFPAPPDPGRPQLAEGKGGYLIVDQEPVVIDRAPGATAVVNWVLPSTGNFRFERDGIATVGQIKRVVEKGKPPVKNETVDTKFNQLTKCTVLKDGLEVNCVFPPTLPPGVYAYEIRVRDKSGTSIVIDPSYWVPE